MTVQQLDVIGFGNAIVDVLARTEDAFLDRQGMRKGGMTLIDEARAETVYSSMGPGVEISGGSAANTMVGVAALGGQAGFIGKVRDDELGGIFAHDIRAAGVTYATPPAGSGPATARCLILVTPDGERTMNTYLGAAQDLGPADVDEATVAAATVTYLEGYLWDPPAAKEAFLKASGVAHKAGRTVSLTLSDAFCVGRYRAEFLDLMRKGVVDLVFANEAELMSLYETDFDTALAQLRADAKRAVVTRSEKGALSMTADELVSVPAFPVAKVVDTTGAGDLFAAGYLHGFSRGFDAEDCLKLGALCASEIISHIGARPERKLKEFALENGLRV
ncbi:PfkB domain protein [Ancylobacter novellus DSM 506]|uniref:PfkB domain protein n=1 Tax=Ancylobacter novellus (strain ATCC 8093 / DSM 506 / JCM 20403 / CCM 1077 / IAM 12100 / NBRC 12443 / NCIMB 10456) TaxID=639283 RepID=D6ZZP6_ANCN5|nr:adenosine kinase [Ancylobacter novellus]ADH91241.1 PfkB domain protein [Ancylobacter novellus DSM 506]